MLNAAGSTAPAPLLLGAKDALELLGVSREAAQQYIGRGWAVVPLPSRQKAPKIRAWQKRTFAPDDFAQGNNIGVKLGESSDGLVDVDIDHPAALALAAELLPATGATFGHGDRPATHWLYVCNSPGRTRRWTAADGATIVELRSTGGQTMFPPSVHPSGESVEWTTRSDPATADWNELVQACEDLAAAARRSLGYPPVPKSADKAQRQRPLNRATRYVDAAKPSAEGGRNAQAFSIAGHLAAFCEDTERLTETEILDLLRTRWNPRNAPPLPEEELVCCVSSALVNGTPRADRLGTCGASAKEQEPLPDPLPIPNVLLSVVPFDQSLLPESLRTWIVDIAERMQCPPEFPAVAAMIGLAGVVGRKIGIRPKRRDDWLVVPNLWGAMIGRPSVMKSPPLREAMKPLKRLIAKADNAYQDELAEQAQKEAESKLKKSVLEAGIKKAMRTGEDYADISTELVSLMESAASVRKRYTVNDSTVEKLGEILAENANGVILHRDELIGLLKYLERDGQEAARAFYLEGWAGDGQHETDRIGRGNVHIPAVCLSLIGTIQPGPLGQYLRGAVEGGTGDDGLMQRLQLAVWPDDPGEWRNVDRWPDSEARKAAFDTFEALDIMTPGEAEAEADQWEADGVPFLRFDGRAQERFDAWMYARENRLRAGDEHPSVESHLTKYRSLIPSLALLICLAEGGRGSVGLSALERAIGWGDYLETHARRIYTTAIDPTIGSAKALAKRILDGNVADGFALRDVYHKGWSGLARREDVANATAYLIDLDWLREEVKPTAGRSKTLYRVNPKIAVWKSHDVADGRAAKTDKSPSGGFDGTGVEPDGDPPPCRRPGPGKKD